MKHLPDLLTLQHRRPLFRMSVHSSVRLSTFMSKFDIYVKVSILINCKTKQPSNLAWNISLTSWLCDTGAHFSIRLSVRQSVCPSLNSSVRSKFDSYVKVSILINYKTKQPSNLVWNISLTSWLCDIGARFSIRLSVSPSVCLLTVLLCRSWTFTSKVSILINYNSTTTIIPCMTHLPDLLTWQICWPSDLDLYFALHWLWHNLRWRSRSSQL